MRTPAEAPKIAVKTDVDPELARAVQAAAQREDRTVSGWVRHVLTKALSAETEAR